MDERSGGPAAGRSFVRRPRKRGGEQAEAAASAEGAGKPEGPRPGAVTPGGGAPPRTHDRERARIVVPRQERGEPRRSELDIELREVRLGTTARVPYLRVVPRRRQFTRVATGYFEATRAASRPRGPIERIVASIKGVMLGSPFASSQAIHERLTKIKALAIFSSDALSSSAYATEEILLMLVLAGSGALHNALPIAGVIALLLAIVTISYRQTIKAYPGGGGAYIVAHENLGRVPGLMAGAALLVDYVLTVSVSVAAGVAAVTSAFPDVHDLRVLIGVFMIALLALGNLRGIREAGTLFAIPTYCFIISMSTVIVFGLIKVIAGDAPGSLLHEAPPAREEAAVQGLTLFLILRAFTSGSAALTGIEAISNGVPAFKPPEVRNARTTMTVMALILGFLFLGVTFLASRYGIVPSQDNTETVVSILGKRVLGENVLYYAYQVATALVLFLAANTSFNGFPPLAAILSRDRFLPRQFSFRGDRLAFSNGIMLLAAAAAILLIAFQAEVTRLIPLYALGVFVSFTLSQAGMVRRFSTLRDAGWRASVVISVCGAAATGVVAVIIGLTKFTHGAWISVLMMAVLMVVFSLIHRHYRWFESKLRVDESRLPAGVPTAVPMEPGGPRDHVIVPVDDVNKITMGAIGVARAISSRITAVHLTDERGEAEQFRERWSRAAPDVPLLIIESPYRSFVAPMLAFLESLEEAEADQRVVLVLPSFVARHWWEKILHNRDVLRLRPFLEGRPNLRVVDFPYRLEDEQPSPPSGPAARPVPPSS